MHLEPLAAAASRLPPRRGVGPDAMWSSFDASRSPRHHARYAILGEAATKGGGALRQSPCRFPRSCAERRRPHASSLGDARARARPAPSEGRLTSDGCPLPLDLGHPAPRQGPPLCLGAARAQPQRALATRRIRTSSAEGSGSSSCCFAGEAALTFARAGTWLELWGSSSGRSHYHRCSHRQHRLFVGGTPLILVHRISNGSEVLRVPRRGPSAPPP